MPAPRPIAGRYEILETLFADGRGEELRARDLTLGREVLLVRRPCAVELEGRVAVERALREARALAGLRHPAIQKLHDVLEDESGPTLVLEPVAGETLEAHFVREKQLAPQEVRKLGIELADALATVHAAGAVHRDVSERNIVLRADGTPCLTGFRLAKPATLSGATSIQYGQVDAASGAKERLVLPLHPAPEQLAGETASARTDLFALACVLYRALTGRAAMSDHLLGGWHQPPDPARLVPGTPPALAKLVMACLARSPIGRPQSAVELRDALRAISTPNTGAVGTRTRSLVPAARLGLGLAASVALALLGWRFWPRSEATAQKRGLAASEESPPSHPATVYKPGYGKALALLIGIGEEYQKNGFQPLANAKADVNSVAQALEDLPADHWDTTPLLGEEATHDGIVDALAKLQAQLGPEDRALIYYAGHGERHETSDSSGWIIPADAQTLDRDPARKKWIRFDDFARFLDETRAKHVLIAMDCCFGGRLATMRSAGARDYEESFLTTRARVVLAAGRSNERVQDSGPKREHSPFAEVFLAELKPRKGGVTSSMLHSQMLRHFADERVNQKPVLAPVDGDEGEFVFLLGQ